MVKLAFFCVVLSLLSGFVFGAFRLHPGVQIAAPPLASDLPAAQPRVQSPNKAKLVAIAPSYAMVSVKKFEGDKTNAFGEKIEEDKDDMYTYPELVWPGHEDRIHKANEALRSIVSDFLTELRGGNGGTYALDSTVETITPKLVSVRIHVDRMCEGAAHPYHGLVCFNFDLERNYQIKAADIRRDDRSSIKNLECFCCERMQKREPWGGDEQKESHRANTKDPTEFTITGNGVRFVFDYGYGDGDYREVTVPFCHKSLKAARYAPPNAPSDLTVDYDYEGD